MISHEEKMASLPPERRARIQARAEEALKESRAIRELRSLLGLTQEEFAERVGVSQLRISRLENGSRGLTFEDFSNFVRSLGREWDFRDLRFDNVPFGRTQFAPTLWTKSVTVGVQDLRPLIDQVCCSL
ncbi:MAG: helix-turn-helix transcriptional regulator [Microcystis aeruginosa W13-11]|nr:helix-turn-helix transcriptional regulator [Microcystis aeruginosa W13-11]